MILIYGDHMCLFFVFILFNTAIPLSLNYLGEFLSLTGVFLQSPFISILGASGIVLSAAYSIWLYNRIAFGAWSKYLNYTTDITRREFMLLLPLLFVAVVFGIFPNIILDSVHASTSGLLYSIT